MITLTVNGISYKYPQEDDEGWGSQATQWAVSVSDVLAQLRSPTAPTATAGQIRLGNTDSIQWRDFANTQNAKLYFHTDDKLYIQVGVNPPIDLTSAAAGNVTGPGSATDNAVSRFDGTTGQTIQNSLVTISDAGLLTAPSVSSDLVLTPETRLQSGGGFGGTLSFNNGGGPYIRANAGGTAISVHANGSVAFDDPVTITEALSSGSAPTANTLYSPSLPKAWALLTCGAAGTVTVTEGFNVSSASYSSEQLTINFHTALSNANFAALANASVLGTATNAKWIPNTKTTSSFKVRQLQANGNVANYASGDQIQIMVFGQ